MSIPTWRVMVGDVRDQLALLPDASVQTCVTSPPYWGLRDYGTATWDGGDVECDHQQIRGGNGSASEKQVTSAGTQGYQYRNECGKCGARRIDSQIGLEATPDEFVAALVEVFRAVRRVLAADGVLWLNLGDSYATGAGGVGDCPGGGKQGENWKLRGKMTPPNRLKLPGLKPKDLVGIPWRVAFALQADGWYLRSDIIWHKPNPMPESVTDRPTKAHEYVFLLTKGERYFYDAAAIYEPLQTDPRENYPARARVIGRGGLESLEQSPSGGAQQRSSGGLAPKGGNGRNARTVWTITTQPYPEAHFATFPEALPERCIKAGSRLGDVVLDPFTGSGTTGEVAIRLGRSFVGIELNPAYAELARRRIGGAAPLFAVEGIA